MRTQFAHTYAMQRTALARGSTQVSGWCWRRVEIGGRSSLTTLENEAKIEAFAEALSEEKSWKTYA